MKILIVDDSLIDRKLIINALNKAGIPNEVLQAADGEDGFRVLSGNYKDICVIVLDWQMPKMDGMEFMRGVVQVPETSAIPIIMVTASGAEEDKKKAKEVNPNLAGYIVKPYKLEVLIHTMKPFIK